MKLFQKKRKFENPLLQIQTFWVNNKTVSQKYKRNLRIYLFSYKRYLSVMI